MVGLVAVALLAVAAPAWAQVSSLGMGDPLGLINSGAVMPYVGSPAIGGVSPGSISFLEVYSPVGGNAGFHMFFFDANCVKSPVSVGLPLTTNDVEILRIDNIDPGVPADGLVTAAGVDQSGFSLQPLNNPIHARTLWINGGQDFARVLEPIMLDHAEFVGQLLSWSPLRTAATFFAPLEQGGFHTTIYLVCPNNKINSHTASDNAVFPSPLFPELIPNPQGGGLATGLQARVYDDEEVFLRDFTTTCNCLTARAVTALSTVFADVNFAPRGTFTELEGISGTATHAFYGWRAIQAGGLDIFGRLSNGNFNSIRGTLTILDR
ncbi:MAG TPA: hypothetical protein VGT40_03790 [Methylomirabilota bacterium]|nr:hypothetical protein [Methylomirabilota bacterium]